MPTMKDFTTAYGVRANTVRRWCKDFAPYLSDSVNPAAGERRRFTDADADTIDLIATMRSEYEKADAINAALESGERGSWPPEGYKTAQNEPGDTQSVMSMDNAMLAELSHRAGFLEGQLSTIKEDRDYWRERAEKAEQKLLRLEKPKKGEGELYTTNVWLDETPPAADQTEAGSDTTSTKPEEGVPTQSKRTGWRRFFFG